MLGEKEVIVSDTDKDAGMLYKSDKEKMFGYNTSVICENNNYILTVDTNGSNIHDSVAFYDSFKNLINHFDISNIKYFVGNAAYLTNHICSNHYTADTRICLLYQKHLCQLDSASLILQALLLQ